MITQKRGILNFSAKLFLLRKLFHMPWWTLILKLLKQFTFHFAETYDEEYANKIEKSDERFSNFDNERRKESFDQLPKRTFLSDELKGKRMSLNAGHRLKKILKRSNPFFGDSSWNLIASFCGAACTVWHSFVKAHWGVHSILQIRFWFVYFHSRLLHSWKAMQSRKYGISIIMIYFIRHEVNQKLGRAYCPGLSIFSVFMLM